MQTRVAHNFTNALIKNIERTYTYAYLKNSGFNVDQVSFDPILFFEDYVRDEPFKAFMGLKRHGYKQAKRQLLRYGIPYTPDQERRARVDYEVVQAMQKEKADAVDLPYTDEEIKDTEILRLSSGHLTTKKTLEAHEFIDELYYDHDRLTQAYPLEDKLPRTISEEQKKAVINSLRNFTSLIIGGAGTGKSFVTSVLIDQLKENGKKVTVLAPTHKAKEALMSKMKGGGEVRTIHSFVHHPSKEASDVIVIDEAGMLSTPLFCSLMKVYDKQQLVFVGDKNQLEPIEYGRPFEKMMQIFPTYELKENRRSESPDIVNLGREIIGEPYARNIDISNILLVPDLESAYKEGAEVILTYTNRVVDKINSDRKIKNGVPAIHPDFSVGDKVMAKTNRKEYFNGQLFTITDPYTLTTLDGRKRVRLENPRDLDWNFVLAYGLTIHKAQGSEWDTVAYVPSEHDTRSLAYVAVTRARKKLIIVGGLRSEYRQEGEWMQLK